MIVDRLKEALASAGVRNADVAADNSLQGARAVAVPREFFAQAAKALKADGYRLCAEWAADETPFAGGGFAVFAAYNHDQNYLVIKSPVPSGDPSFPSLTKVYIAAWRFERQIQSLMGITPAGHADLRPWIKHEDWPADAYPLRKAFDPDRPLPRVPGVYEWIKAEGEGVYEIAVGPVHAGIIEPGHFRFQCVGEDILNLETRFGYVHKGIEKRFESLSWTEAARLAGRVSGDTTVAHAIGYCRAAEAASGGPVSQRGLWLRALLLERERIANHLGDIGAICNDTAFTFMLYQMAILREKVLRTNKAIFGHRLTMDLVVPGGAGFDVSAGDARTMTKELEEISSEFERLVAIYENNPSLEDRVYGTGVLSHQLAKDLGVVGFVARSCGVKLDARVQGMYPPYNRIFRNVPVLSSGDVHARTWVRIEEVRESINLINSILKAMPDGPASVEFTPPLPGRAGFSVVEGWRGEIVYWVQAGPDGGINRCMVRDPSSVNWIAIEQAIKGNIVPDFPLCNKSFNQSYSGNDL